MEFVRQLRPVWVLTTPCSNRPNVSQVTIQTPPKLALVHKRIVVFAKVATNACKMARLDLTAIRKLFVLWAISVAVKVTKLVVFPNIPVLPGTRKRQVLLLELNFWLMLAKFVLPAIIVAELILPKLRAQKATSAQLVPNLELSSPVWQALIDLRPEPHLSLIVYLALLENTVPQAQEHPSIVLPELTATI